MRHKSLFHTRQIIRLLATALVSISNIAGAQQQTDAGHNNIRLNQVGFYPNAPKIAVVLIAGASKFSIKTTAGTTVFSGGLKRATKPDFAGNHTLIADFSAVKKTGKYILCVNTSACSWPFEISKEVHQHVANASLKAFYFMRASVPLGEKYAGKWARAAGHPDTVVLVHPSAASSNRPAGTIIAAPGGWYDAGDYNKYVVNSGISTGTLLSLYEDFPAYMKTVRLNIPESGNNVPDVLNEVLWNVRWMLKMQDPGDGGVYHKLTNAAFDKFEMPDKGTAPRYVVQKGTAATLDFAAVMAQASRIYNNYATTFPGLADSCLRQAKLAWVWALKHPRVAYDQKATDPKITTGDYGDTNFTDEFIWAAAELAVTTRSTSYLQNITLLPDNTMPLPSWGQVKLLGYYTLAKHEDDFGPDKPRELPEIKKRLRNFADNMLKGANQTAYQTVMDKSAGNFGWGSNSVAANQGVALIQAWLLFKDPAYLKAALSNFDYLLGRNATGYCYLTGYGSKSPMHPHHRPSASDGIVDPVPGLLVGGPNPRMQDGVRVPSIVPDQAYIDDERAYAANEIAINWNAPFAYLANALEAVQQKIN